MARTGDDAAEVLDLDSLLLGELDYLRLKPFGSPRLSERLEHTPHLSRLAAQLYGSAETLSARDEHQRALVRSAARQMHGSAGQALLALLGLTRETSGRSRAYRLDVAGPLMHPQPLAGPTLGRAEYWHPFLEQAVAAIRAVAAPSPNDRNQREPHLRDMALPVIERELANVLAYSLRMPTGSATRAHVVYGSPGSGRFTTCDEALARVTTQNRHVVRLGEPATYHRDLLEVLATYAVDAGAWSLAACEREFQLLVERAPASLGGVILRGATSVDEVLHLLPRRPGVPVLVTARSSARVSLAGIEELPAVALENAEAVRLLRSGHPDTGPELLQDLAVLLYCHVGLLAAGARSSLTAQTLIRRLRRHRVDQVLELALGVNIDLEGEARRIVRALVGDRDALLALDLGLWVSGFGYWDLRHTLGYWFGRDSSPARVSCAQAKLHQAMATDGRDLGLITDVLRRYRAHRMTRLLHQLSQLNITDSTWPGIRLDVEAASTSPLRVDASKESPEVTLLSFIPDNDRGYSAIFTDRAGRDQAQLWRYAADNPNGYVLYEDGQPRGDHQLLDLDRDSAWPYLTRRMIGILAQGEVPNPREHARTVTVQFFEGPIHREVEAWDAPALDLDDLLAAADADDVVGESTSYVRDESIDEEAGELFT